MTGRESYAWKGYNQNRNEREDTDRTEKEIGEVSGPASYQQFRLEWAYGYIAFARRVGVFLYSRMTHHHTEDQGKTVETEIEELI